MPERTFEVFISFASSDGAAFAEAVRVRLKHESPALEIWKDHLSLEGGLPWWEQIQQALVQVRFLVLIVTPSVLEVALAPVVQKELRYARQQGVWIYPVMGAPRDEIPFDRFPRWLEKLTKTTFYDFRPAWPSPWDQPGKGHDYEFVHEWDRFVRQLDRPGRPARVRNTAPTDFPANYVRREAEYQRLRALLLDVRRRSPIAITSSLHGPGGFGKTTLAKDLCRDPEIQQAFDDGILWVTLGEKPNVRDALAKLYEELTGEPSAFRDEEQAVQQLRSKLEDKDILIVIDDVWIADHVKPFLGYGGQAARLLTTRELSVAAATGRAARSEAKPGANGYPPWVTVDEPDQELAFEMLVRGLPDRPPVDQLPAYRDLAVRRLGRWPLLISLVAAEMMLKIISGTTPQQALADANQGLDEEGPFDFEPSGNREEAALKRERSAWLTIEASLKRLDEQERQKYEMLAIFHENAAVPCTTLRALWGLSLYKTRQLAENFGRRSLLEYDPKNPGIRLHDVFRSYLVQRLSDAAAIHVRMIDGWGDLYNLPDDYAWRHLAHHLIAAGGTDRLRELLLDYGWLRAKFGATDAIALRNDAASLPDEQDLKYLARAFGQSAHVLARDPSALRGQLYGRLMGIESAGIERLLAQIRRSAEERPWLRPLEPSLIPADSPLLRTLEGHSGRVNAVAVTSDGRTALSGSEDRTLRVWSLAIAEAWPLEGHTGGVNAVAVTPDGRTALSGSEDHNVHVWDLGTREARTLTGHSGGVNAVAVTPDGRTALSGSEDRSVLVWDLDTREARTLEGHGDRVHAVAVTTEGRTALSGSSDRTVRVWNLDTSEARTLEGHGGRVNAVAVTPDGHIAVSGSSDSTVRVWNLDTGQTRTLKGHGDWVYAVAVTPDGRTAISGSDDRTLRVWNLATGQARILEGHGDSVRAVAVTPDGHIAVSGSFDDTVRVWDLDSGEARTRKRRGGRVVAVAVNQGGHTAVSGSDDGTVWVWDLATGQARSFKGHDGPVDAVAVTPDGRIAVSGSYDRTLRVWNLTTGDARSLEWRGDWVRAVAVTPDGRTVVSGSVDGTVRVWDLDIGEARTLKAHDDLVLAVAVTPDGRTAVWGSHDGTVRVWNVATGEARTLNGHSGWVNTVALTPDGRTAVSGSSDHTVRVWDLAVGDSRTLNGHGGEVNAVAMTPDGSALVTGSSDCTVRVWDLAAGAVRATFHADAAVTSCTVSADGRIVAAGDISGQVHFLRLEEGAVAPSSPEDPG